MSYKTVVGVMMPVVDEEGNYLDKDGKVIDPTRKSKRDDKIQEPVMEEQMFYLLHWGLHMDIVEDQRSGQRYPVSYTVGICQHLKSGAIKVFAPEELKVIGKEKL